jgi:hypothetical protein
LQTNAFLNKETNNGICVEKIRMLIGASVYLSEKIPRKDVKALQDK